MPDAFSPADANPWGRRRFIAAGAAMLATSPVLGARRVAGDDPLTVGVIGCGGRGTGAACDALAASAEVRIVSLGDLFPDRLESCRNHLASVDPARATVPRSRCFSGFEAYEAVLGTDCDLVILATPPGFRPVHFAAAIDAGKHVFMEKPAAVDATGVRAVLAASARADDRGLCVVAGTQRRYEHSYREAIARIHAGDLGIPLAGRCCWNMGSLWHVAPDPARSEMENHCRNWLYHTWLSGDHIVEQHVHNLDVLNWAFGSPPSSCFGVGGRQARTGPEFGQVFDHFGLEYRWGGGEWALSMCRQQQGTPGRVEESISGSEGMALLRPGFARFQGRSSWRFAGPNNNPYVDEHVALQRAIRHGPRINDANSVAESTLTAIMGREAAYTGAEITWEQAMASRQDLMPAVLEFAECPQMPVPIPGRTRFI